MEHNPQNVILLIVLNMFAPHSNLPIQLSTLPSSSLWGWLAHGKWLVLLLSIMLIGCRGVSEQLPSSSKTEASVTLAQPPISVDFTTQWVITATEARSLLSTGATLLDAREQRIPKNPLKSYSLEGAITVTWQQFSEPQAPQRGNLLQDQAELGKRLRAVGIDRDRPVIVFGDPSQGWGEEGRIVWMLRSLGHQQVVLVDGGYDALQAVGLSPGKATTVASTPGNFIPAPQEAWQISRDALQEAIASPKTNLVLVDTREPREFAGATPYGESRGGHLPGAVNLHFSQLLDEQGYLLAEEEIRDRLTALGITPEQTIVAYCTGGIRSGWLAAVLVDLGYDAKNYAGSMWEWSAGDAADYPLEQL